jgi:hypothetical protein
MVVAKEASASRLAPSISSGSPTTRMLDRAVALEQRDGGRETKGQPVIGRRQIKIGRSGMRRLTIGIAFALLIYSHAAIAQDTVKIGYIDPLSGGGASVGEVGLKTFQLLTN